MRPRVETLEGWPCPRCKTHKPLEEWHLRTDGNRLRGWCKTCHAEDGRNRRWLRLFNLRPEEYFQILEAQGGACAICHKPPKDGARLLAVDHDHKTGLVRGLLCWGCNVALGKFKDDRGRVLAAADYIRSPPATVALGRETYGRVGRVSNTGLTRRKK